MVIAGDLMGSQYNRFDKYHRNIKKPIDNALTAFAKLRLRVIACVFLANAVVILLVFQWWGAPLLHSIRAEQASLHVQQTVLDSLILSHMNYDENLQELQYLRTLAQERFFLFYADFVYVLSEVEALAVRHGLIMPSLTTGRHGLIMPSLTTGRSVGYDIELSVRNIRVFELQGAMIFEGQVEDVMKFVEDLEYTAVNIRSARLEIDTLSEGLQANLNAAGGRSIHESTGNIARLHVEFSLFGSDDTFD